MRYDNDAKQMKFEVLLRVAQLAYAGDLEEKSDSIPYDIIPGRVARFRCCCLLYTSARTDQGNPA